MLVEGERVRLAVAGSRVSRRAWADLQAGQNLLDEATQLLRQAQAEADGLHRGARVAGFTEGLAEARGQAAAQLLQAQAQARDFVSVSEQRIAELAVAIVGRIAPELEQGQLVAALVRQALAAAQAERHLTVRVHARAVAATQKVLQQWRLAHPALEAAQVTADPALQPLDCVVESELGSIQAGFTTQLDAVRTALAMATSTS